MVSLLFLPFTDCNWTPVMLINSLCAARHCVTRSARLTTAWEHLCDAILDTNLQVWLWCNALHWRELLLQDSIVKILHQVIMTDCLNQRLVLPQIRLTDILISCHQLECQASCVSILLAVLSIWPQGRCSLRVASCSQPLSCLDLIHTQHVAEYVRIPVEQRSETSPRHHNGPIWTSLCMVSISLSWHQFIAHTHLYSLPFRRAWLQLASLALSTRGLCAIVWPSQIRAG